MFDAEKGLFLAAALTRYDSNKTVTEEARYGELTFEHNGWTVGEEVTGLQEQKLETHPCSDEELGLVDSNPTSKSQALTYPLHESSVREVRSFNKKFKCIAPEDLLIWGDYNTASTQ